jgi:hypothetical protein
MKFHFFLDNYRQYAYCINEGSGGTPMKNGIAKQIACFTISICFLLLSFPGILSSETEAKGSILGYVFEPDGTTAIEGAVFKAVNVSTGAIHESTISNSNGAFKVSGIETGFYEYVVTTADGTFVSDSAFGLRVQGDGVEKMAIMVNPVKKSTAPALSGFPQADVIKGMSYIGRVLSFDLKTMEAEVFIERGAIQKKDKVLIKGEESEFDMNVKDLKKEGADVGMLVAGEAGLMKLKQSAAIGDAIYMAADKGLLPLILGVVGVTGGTAAVIGTAGVSGGTEGVIVYDKFKWEPKEGCQPQPRSPFRPKH